MKRRVVVTGLGVVTSLSQKVEDLFERLCRGESGVHLIRQFDTTDYKVKFGGDVYDWDTGDYIDRKEVKRIDRFTQFALVAGIDAVRDSGLDLSKEEPFRCGVILGSGIGGLNEIETQMARLLFKGPDRVSALTIPKLMLNAAGGNLSIHFGIRGPNYTVATACARKKAPRRLMPMIQSKFSGVISSMSPRTRAAGRWNGGRPGRSASELQPARATPATPAGPTIGP